MPTDTETVQPTVQIGPQSWRGILRYLLAAVEMGTPDGRRIAIEELERMAAAADMAVADRNEPAALLPPCPNDSPEQESADVAIGTMTRLDLERFALCVWRIVHTEDGSFLDPHEGRDPETVLSELAVLIERAHLASF